MRDLPAHPRGDPRRGEGARQQDKLTMSGAKHVDRRTFLASVAAVGGALALGFEIPFGARAVHASSSPRAIPARIVISPADTVTTGAGMSRIGIGSIST